MNKTMLTAVLATTLLASTAALAADMPGEAVFEQHCTACHALEHRKVGPAVKDMNKDPAVLRQFITHGKGMMPNFSHQLSPQQIDEVIAYLRSREGK